MILFSSNTEREIGSSTYLDYVAMTAELANINCPIIVFIKFPLRKIKTSIFCIIIHVLIYLLQNCGFATIFDIVTKITIEKCV
ncbi:hypothetical protein PLEI_3060 [Photobacterium leiognathi lrivu.4.1]|uniref:Uncharacterized protein n=1 Tax=Photobacterium leiognathi lrivu.4.1 TaxID=1248232 RepID=V5F2D4_PHOLE|nr:hypothetical protein PLEI_3060 [Photobacterium leiognathi lrivu.4.1]